MNKFQKIMDIIFENSEKMSKQENFTNIKS